MKHKLLSLVLIIPSVACAVEMPKDKVYTNSIGMKFVRIEPGSFLMGSENAQFDEQPVHRVVISQSFKIGMHEVTNAQYEQFDPDHRRFRGQKGLSKNDDEAVFFVSWNDAMAFCRWLTQKEQRTYRLPTEAEWEYACRAGTTSQFSTGDELPQQYLTKTRHGEHQPHPAPLHVGRTPPNPWGIYNMHGNLEEWCLDWYGPYESETQTDPVGRIKGDFRITRGGSHSAKPRYLRSANRMGTLPDDKHWLIGFRVVLSEMPKTDPEASPTPQLYQINVKQVIPDNIEQGPDPEKPYFQGPRPYVRIKDTDGPFYRHNHDPALTVCANGDLLAIWYTTPDEASRELSIAASRFRHGADQWEPASQFWNAPDRNDHAPALWTDSNGKIYHFNGLAEAESFRFLSLVMRTSTDNGVTWFPARLIDPIHDFRHQPIDSVIQTREGSIILLSDATMHVGGGSVVWISNDTGLTWNCLSQGCPSPIFAKGNAGAWIAGIHAGIVQLSDGRLFALGRSDSIDGMMPISISSDMGRNWTYSASTFQPIGGGQRLVLNRLREGPLFFASFCRDMPIVDASGAQRKVSGLYAALSFDDGKTWPVRRLASDDGPDREIKNPVRGSFTMGIGKAERGGYMSGVQTRNGLIHLITSNNHYTFNLKWLMTLPPAP